MLKRIAHAGLALLWIALAPPVTRAQTPPVEPPTPSSTAPSDADPASNGREAEPTRAPLSIAEALLALRSNDRTTAGGLDAATVAGVFPDLVESTDGQTRVRHEALTPILLDEIDRLRRRVASLERVIGETGRPEPIVRIRIDES